MTNERVRVEPLWTAADLAHYLGIPVKTLYQWKWRGEGPPFRKVGRHLRYDPADVRRWLDSLGSEVA
jgi:predicted DNA-binding transcriptional regulator AlpA